MQMPMQAVRDVVRRRAAAGIPTAMSHWYNAETERLFKPQLDDLRGEFPDDSLVVSYLEPGVWEAPEAVGHDYRWAISPRPTNAVFRENNWTLDGVIDRGQGVLPSWDRLDELLAHMQELDRPEAFAQVAETVHSHPGQYVQGMLNHTFYDRLWKLHGLTNIMTDFFLEPEKVQQLTHAVLQLELKWVRRYAQAGVHAIRCADDYGHQSTTLFSPTIFRTVFKPLYSALCAEAHRLGMDVWLHCCGAISGILGDFAEAGIDMMHPIQVGCFDEGWVATSFSGKIGFHLGMDVQHLLVEATAQEVEKTCRERLRRFANPAGGVAAGAGNAIMPETPLANMRAYHKVIREFRAGEDGWPPRTTV